jgi:2-oxoglutarate dehydrogenase E1 component
LISNFGLSTADLNTVLMLLSDQYPTVYLQEIITHLDTIYVIGVEYMYIRKPEVVEWIQKKLGVNDNQPKFSIEEKKSILNKLNQAVSFENFCTQICRSKRFSLEGGESIIPALDALIEKAEKGGAICNGNGTSWSFECFGISLENLLKISLLNLTVKIMTKNILTEM